MGEGRRKQQSESRRSKRPDTEPLPDLSAFMNDRFFFGDTINYPPTGSQNKDARNENDNDTEEEEEEEEEEEFELNQKSINGRDNGTSLSRRTQEWLEEARQVVSSSPVRKSFQFQPSPGHSILNYARHEHLSRSARRSTDSASLLSASPKPDSRQAYPSSRFSGTPDFSDSRPNLPSSRFSGTSDFSDSRPNLPSSRFNGASNQAKKGAGAQDSFGNVMKKLGSQTEKGEFRSSRPPVPGRQSNLGHDTLGDMLGKKHGNGGKEEKYRSDGKEDKRAVGALSPPRRSVHIHARSYLASASVSASALPYCVGGSSLARADSGIAYEQQDVSCLNNFLEKQRERVNGGGLENANIVLSATNPSTSSMVAAIGYAWLLAETGEADTVPVINMKRTQMRDQKQAACLFHDLAIDARSLLFADEVDMERFCRTTKLKVIVIGQDALCINTLNNDNDGVDSPCTILIDEYYQRGYKLLEAPYLRKLLLAGILIDTQNSLDCVKWRDARALDLLLIDASPNHKNNLLHLLNKKHKDESFEEVLRSNYGEPVIKVKSQAKPASSSGGKNFITQTLSKWFGFGPKK